MRAENLWTIFHPNPNPNPKQRPLVAVLLDRLYSSRSLCGDL